VMHQRPAVASAQQHRGEHYAVEGHIVLAQEIVEVHLLRILPPLPPAIWQQRSGNTDVSNRRIKPDLEPIGITIKIKLKRITKEKIKKKNKKKNNKKKKKQKKKKKKKIKKKKKTKKKKKQKQKQNKKKTKTKKKQKQKKNKNKQKKKIISQDEKK